MWACPSSPSTATTMTPGVQRTCLRWTSCPHVAWSTTLARRCATCPPLTLPAPCMLATPGFCCVQPCVCRFVCVHACASHSICTLTACRGHLHRCVRQGWCRPQRSWAPCWQHAVLWPCHAPSTQPCYNCDPTTLQARLYHAPNTCMLSVGVLALSVRLQAAVMHQ